MGKNKARKDRALSWTPVDVASKLLVADLQGFLSLEEADGDVFSASGSGFKPAEKAVDLPETSEGTTKKNKRKKPQQQQQQSISPSTTTPAPVSSSMKSTIKPSLDHTSSAPQPPTKKKRKPQPATTLSLSAASPTPAPTVQKQTQVSLPLSTTTSSSTSSSLASAGPKSKKPKPQAAQSVSTTSTSTTHTPAAGPSSDTPATTKLTRKQKKQLRDAAGGAKTPATTTATTTTTTTISTTTQNEKKQAKQPPKQQPQQQPQQQPKKNIVPPADPNVPLSKKAQAKLEKQAKNELFKQRRKQKKERKRLANTTDTTLTKKPKGEKPKVDLALVQPKELPEQSQTGNWDQFTLHPLLIKALTTLRFTQPTPIQEKCLPAAIRDWRDIIAAAETGSGKTLAFGLPIVHRLLSFMDDGLDLSNTFCALILSPTRELALQIQAHIKAVCMYSTIKCAAILGGVAKVKQQRVLSQRPQIVIATPGRLWELIQEAEPHLTQGMIAGLRFFVLDEADRMISSGHFPELTKILNYLQTAHTRQGDGNVTFEGEENFQGALLTDEQKEGETDGGEGDEGDDEGDDEFDLGGEQLAESKMSDNNNNIKTKSQNKAQMQSMGKEDLGKKRKFEEEDENIDEFAQMLEDEGDEGDEGDEEDEQLFMQQPANGQSKKPKEKQSVFVTLEEHEEQMRENASKEQDEEGSEDEDGEMAQLKRSQGVTSDKDDKKGSNKKFRRGINQTMLKRGKYQVESKPEFTRPANQPKRQTFLFSATLMLASQGRVEHNKKGKKLRTPTETMVNLLRQKIDFQTDPLVVDLSPATQIGSNIVEKRIECAREDKDTYLYYFLLNHPGKTLIFVNAISCLRRLHSLFACLGIHIYPLHAQMQQRQRLKNLDRFKAQENAVIVATDVAARGLDIPSVPYVVHYQIPRSSEIYVHRAGRTARAGKEGTSLALVDPEDTQNFKRICQILNKEHTLPMFEIDQLFYKAIKARVKQARKVDEAASRLNRTKTKQDWLETSAKEMDIDLEGTVFEAPDEEQERKDKQQLAALRANLKALLAEPLIREGVERKFLTRNASIPTIDGRVDLKTIARH